MMRPRLSECPVCGTSQIAPIDGVERRREEPLAYRCSMQHIVMPTGADASDLLELLYLLDSRPGSQIQ
jgi:hypothetical protein